MQFFEPIPVEEVHMRVDELGRPAGQARCVFATPEDAKQALATKNREYMGERYIELQIDHSPPNTETQQAGQAQQQSNKRAIEEYQYVPPSECGGGERIDDAVRQYAQHLAKRQRMVSLSA